MSPIVGKEWAVDAGGCRPDALRDLGVIEALFARIVAELGLTAASAPVWHVFPEPGGITGMLLLTESHLVCHTYPEHGVATFNLYCCSARPDWPWQERLEQSLGAQHVRVRMLSRGATVEELAAR